MRPSEKILADFCTSESSKNQPRFYQKQTNGQVYRSAENLEVVFTTRAPTVFEANETDAMAPKYKSFKFLTHTLKSIVLFHASVVNMR